MSTQVTPSQAFWLFMILGGCFLNSVVLELIVKQDPGAGGLMTFAQFLLVSVLFLPKFLSLRNPETGSFQISLIHRTPFKEYAIMTLIFFVGSVASNKAFALGVSQPFNVIFRSLSLLVSYLIGMLWFGKRYSLKQFVAVFLVTLGVMITTFGELYLKSGLDQRLAQCCSEQPYWSQAYMVLTNDPVLGLTQTSPTESTSVLQQAIIFLITLFLLSLTLVGLAVLGHLQGKAYRDYDCTPEENMYYLHLLPLPMFLTLTSDLKTHYLIWNASEPITILGLVTMPWLWWLCILNAITQVICLLGVHNTTSSMGTLVCTFATTVRKFFSLIFSVWYFQSPFTPAHTIGSVCVFIGTYLFATAPNPESKPHSIVNVHKKND
jgi:UDP-xylose/UDP-N-acetylglucosamine transporter B4